MDRVAIICLGALGDICNALPIALHEFQQDNNVTFYVAREFESILDGVTYCDKEVWPGHYSECLKAAEHAANSGKYDRIMVVQCYGTNIERHTDSYCKEAWRAVGKLHLWGKLPLAFDNRTPVANNVAIDTEILDKRELPILLVFHSGKSSPFPFRKELMDLVEGVKDKFHILDLSEVRMQHFYDLIDIFEVAACLIATDSGPLHLANAVPKLPVIALITDRPDMWHGSPRQANHIARIRYGDFPHSKDIITKALLSVIEPRKNTEPALFHIWNDYDRSDDGNIHRHRLAKKTWEKVYRSNRWVPYPVHINSLTRTSLELGEPRHTPYVKDAINLAASEAQPHDILVFTNDDGLLLERFTDHILDTLRDRPAMWCPRWELPMGAEQQWGNPKGYKHCGADVFAFTKQWWTENEVNFPDHLISFEAWDLNLRMLIEMTGGVQVEGLVAHYIHQPVWHSPEHREGIGNLHNRRLFQRWLANRNLKWPAP